MSESDTYNLLPAWEHGMSESADRPPDSAWICFLCNALNLGGHLCARCKRPGRALEGTDRSTPEEYCTATKAAAAKHWHWHTTEHTSFRVGPHSTDHPTLPTTHSFVSNEEMNAPAFHGSTPPEAGQPVQERWRVFCNPRKTRWWIEGHSSEEVEISRVPYGETKEQMAYRLAALFNSITILEARIREL